MGSSVTITPDMQAGPVTITPDAPRPGFLANPKAYLENQAQEMGQAAQKQNYEAVGPESQDKPYLARMGHSLLSLAPSTMQVIDKMVAGGMDWKNAIVMASGAVDPAIPAAYFGGHAAAQLTGVEPGIEAGNRSPENVQNALLSASAVAGAGATAGVPQAGSAARAVPVAVKTVAKATNDVLAKAPGAVGGALGAVAGGAIGHATGLPEAGLAGIIAGRQIGASLGSKYLPKLRIPTGEEAPPTAETSALEAPAEAAPAPAAKPATEVYRDATLNKRNIPEYAGEEIPDAKLPEATSSVIDQALPKADRLTNLRTKAQVDFALKRGDIASAESALDSAAKDTPNWPPARPNVVPATQNIRETDAMIAQAEAGPRRYGSADAADDRALSQEMTWDLQKHGYRAESEARREFIARNSTGVTKGELVQAAQNPQPADLTSQWQQALDAINKQKAAQ
jgi:hypothetical protein